MILVVLTSRLRGALYAVYLRLLGAKVGRGLQMDRGAGFRHLPHRGLAIGSGVYFGRGAIIDVPRGGRLTVGNGTWIYHFTVVSAGESVTIGEDVQIAERCSIRDGDHGMELDSAMKWQPSKRSPVVIGDGAWLGCGVAVLRGSTIGEGAVVGANSVVRGDIASNAIAVGAPARAIRFRGESR